MPLRESGRRAAECALLGVLFFVCALPVVTAGAAWSAVAEICACWQRGVEPPLARTFAAVVRRDFVGGLGMSALAFAAAGVLLEARVSLAAHLPGARAEAVALALTGATAVCLVALAFPRHAAVPPRGAVPLHEAVPLREMVPLREAVPPHEMVPLHEAVPPRAAAVGGRAAWGRSLRDAATLAVTRPWVVPATAVALGIPAFLVIVFPALLVFIAGPTGYAVSAVYARASGRYRGEEGRTGWQASARR